MMNRAQTFIPGMRKEPARRGGGALARALVITVVLSGLPDAVRAQEWGVGPTTQLDAYGNALPSPRRFGRGAFDAFPSSATSYSTFFGPSLLRGRLGAPEVAPRATIEGRVLGMSNLPGYARRTRRTAPLLLQQRQAFTRYGGFGRQGASQPDPLEAILTRHEALIDANAFAAPVRRIFWRGGALSFSRHFAASPSAARGAAEDARAGSVATRELANQLSSDAWRGLSAPAEHAWRLFREGAYRQAARGFEAAITLKPEDLDLRLGEFFCYMAIQATSSSLARLAEIMRRFENPFAGQLDMKQRFGSRMALLEFRARATTLSLAETINEAVAAAQILALWHLGETDSAVQAARALRDRSPGGSFAHWPDLMARATGSGASG